LPLIIVSVIMYLYTGVINRQTNLLAKEQLNIMVLSENVDEHAFYAINVYERFAKEGIMPDVQYSQEQMRLALSDLEELGSIITTHSEYNYIRSEFDQMKQRVENIKQLYSGLGISNLSETSRSQKSVAELRDQFNSGIAEIVKNHETNRAGVLLERFASLVHSSVNKDWATDPKFLSENLRQQEQLLGQIRQQLSGDDLDKFNRIDNLRKEYFTAATNFNTAVANALADINELVKLSGEVTENSYVLQDAAKEMVFNSANYINNSLMTSRLFLFVGVLLCILIIIVTVINLNRNIVRPLEKGIETGSRIADGDLTIKPEYTDQNDEIGKLTNSMAKMTENLQQIVRDIDECANEISDSSSKLQTASQQMTQSANEQAAGAEEVSSSIEEMASSIAQNSDNASKTEQIALKASATIQNCSESAKSSVTAMNDIASKISVVDEIAFQTNILALNAAVEAARAGDNGKGFAVVAAEVRKLAEKCAIAAREINQVSVEAQTVSSNTGAAFTDVLPEIDRTTTLVREISASCREQASGSEQINIAVQRFNTTTQQFTTISDDMASNSQNLSTQAERLIEMISFFKL